MDEWNPEPEQRFDAEWLASEQERLRRQEEAWIDPPAGYESVNGSGRADDGRFAVLPEQVSRTDGTMEHTSDAIEELALTIMAQARRARAVAPVFALESAKAMRRLCDLLEYEAVAIARGYGWSWRDVGETLGVSESAAHRRFARAELPRKRRPKS